MGLKESLSDREMLRVPKQQEGVEKRKILFIRERT